MVQSYILLPENSGNTRDGTSQSNKRLVTFVDQTTPGNDFDGVYYRTSGDLGDNINRAMKNRIRFYHFIVRTFVFMLLYSVGYGLLATLITPSISRLLTLGGDRLLSPVVLAAVCFIGFLADQKRYM